LQRIVNARGQDAHLDANGKMDRGHEALHQWQ
jgi:hypothetical protein